MLPASRVFALCASQILSADLALRFRHVVRHTAYPLEARRDLRTIRRHLLVDRARDARAILASNHSRARSRGRLGLQNSVVSTRCPVACGL